MIIGYLFFKLWSNEIIEQANTLYQTVFMQLLKILKIIFIYIK